MRSESIACGVPPVSHTGGSYALLTHYLEHAQYIRCLDFDGFSALVLFTYQPFHKILESIQNCNQSNLEASCCNAELLTLSVREGLRDLKKEYEKSEEDLKALQSVGQIIGEVLRQLDEERCTWISPPPPYFLAPRCDIILFSHCEGIKWSSLCGGMPCQGGQIQTCERYVFLPFVTSLVRNFFFFCWQRYKKKLHNIHSVLTVPQVVV